MKTKTIFFLSIGLLWVMGTLTKEVYARDLESASSYGGTYTGWPTTWVALNSLNDPDDALSNERIDFVGDSSAPGVYYTSNSDYLFFRVRVDDGTVTEFSDTHLILIDQGQNGTLDYAFMWDTQSNDQTNHGLEFGIPGTVGGTWATTNMNDLDSSNGQKIAPPDFGLSNGDGYIRILNGQPTTNFGTTTFIDFAISWSYLTAHTTLGKGETWNIQLGSINNANDHGWIDDDVAGGVAPTASRTFPGTVSYSPTSLELESFRVAPRMHDGFSGVLYSLSVLLVIIGVVFVFSSRTHRDEK